MLEPRWEVYALRYSHLDRRAEQNFIDGDRDPRPMGLAYYSWLVRDQRRTIVVDTGFDRAGAARRGKQLLRPVQDGLASLDVDPREVGDVVFTHLHADHAGNDGLFEHARCHVQRSELAFATGPAMSHAWVSQYYEADDVAALLRRLYDGHVTVHDGDGEIAPGVTVHLVGGHTAGMQVVRVQTARGPVVLASDASHFYANFQQRRPFPVLLNAVDELDGYDTLLRLAASPDHVIPGHDPLVLAGYPSPGPELDGWVARLDLKPETSYHDLSV